MRRTISIATAVLVAALTLAAAPDGTLTITSPTVKSGEVIRVTYSTPGPDPKNWLGLYAEPGNGPVGQEYVGPSLKWTYVPSASGSASLPTDGLEPGDYSVYYLAKDGYAWLAQPARVKVVSNEPLHFVTDGFTLRNARAKSPYAASVKGLVRGEVTAFRKSEGPSWLVVGADGAVTGTPPASASDKTATFKVSATGPTGESAVATAHVRVRPPGAPLVPELRSMSWNLWHGGSQVRGGREKQLKFLLDQDVDVVGLQETSGTSARELAEALGWDHFQAGGDLGIISRYPIVARGPLPSASGLAGISARIRLDDKRERDLVIWNAHLGYTPYGPYDACFGQMSQERLLARETESGRTPQITKIMEAMRADLAASARTPVLLTGDFNAPSHLDWTAANGRCGYGPVAWPTSIEPERAGLRDSFRVAHPDPAAEPGVTWSPIYETFTGGYGHDAHKGEPEPQDRIDFIHFKGKLEVKDSRAVVEGSPAPIPGHQDNAWTSDHAAVLTTFAVR